MPETTIPTDDSALHAALATYLITPTQQGTFDEFVTGLVAAARAAGYVPRSEIVDQAAQIVRDDESPFHGALHTETFWRSREAVVASIEALR